MKHKSFLFYYLTSFLPLGLIPIFALIFNDGSMDFDQAAARTIEETALEWTSNLIVMIRLIIEEPILLLIVLGYAAPALAAIIVLIFSKKENKWSTFFGLLNPLKNLEWAQTLKR
jgi:hypothetical protein